MTATRRSPLSVDRLDDRLVPAGVHAAYAVTQDWGSGFQAEVRLTNDDPVAVPFTALQFTLPSTVTSVWDARLTSHVGTRYAVTNAGWNAAVPAGGVTSFGFTAARGSSTAATDFALNGVALDSPVPPPTPPPAVSASVAFHKTSDWGIGMTGELVATNTGTAAIRDWRIQFDLPGVIGSLWGGSVVSHVGNRYTVAPTVWNPTLAPGAAVTVGFVAAPGGIAATNLALTGTGVPTVPPANRPPVAAPDAAATRAGTPVTVNVLANDSDPDGDRLGVTAVSPATGTAAVNADGTVTYTPAAGFVGTAVVGYTVGDGRGGTATGTLTVTVTAPPATAPGAWPARVFAPYVDATLYPTFDLAAATRAAGVKFFTLAFVTADPQGRPAWGGYASYGAADSEFATGLKAQIATLRAQGGDVAVSFGGASGQELAQVVTSVPALAAAYRSVIQAYGLTHLDFDIEGAATADRPSIDRRSQAIAVLQQEAAAAGKELSVRLTLPVLPTGLTADGLAVLQSARRYGARVNVVNVMAMDYGDAAAPNPAGHMGDYAIQAATSLFGQLGGVYGAALTDAQRWAMVGVTPMIGRNDVTTEVFDQQEARELEAWAVQHGIGLLSMWSLNRDRQNPAGAVGYVDPTFSSLVQAPFEFSGIFAPFVG